MDRSDVTENSSVNIDKTIYEYNEGVVKFIISCLSIYTFFSLIMMILSSINLNTLFSSYIEKNNYAAIIIFMKIFFFIILFYNVIIIIISIIYIIYIYNVRVNIERETDDNNIVIRTIKVKDFAKKLSDVKFLTIMFLIIIIPNLLMLFMISLTDLTVINLTNINGFYEITYTILSLIIIQIIITMIFFMVLKIFAFQKIHFFDFVDSTNFEFLSKLFI